MVMISTLSYDATLHRCATAWVEATVTMSCLSGHGLVKHSAIISKQHPVPPPPTR